jgi:hypothetical protein
MSSLDRLRELKEETERRQAGGPPPRRRSPDRRGPRRPAPGPQRLRRRRPERRGPGGPRRPRAQHRGHRHPQSDPRAARRRRRLRHHLRRAPLACRRHRRPGDVPCLVAAEGEPRRGPQHAHPALREPPALQPQAPRRRERAQALPRRDRRSARRSWPRSWGSRSRGFRSTWRCSRRTGRSETALDDGFSAIRRRRGCSGGSPEAQQERLIRGAHARRTSPSVMPRSLDSTGVRRESRQPPRPPRRARRPRASFGQGCHRPPRPSARRLSFDSLVTRCDSSSYGSVAPRRTSRSLSTPCWLCWPSQRVDPIGASVTTPPLPRSVLSTSRCAAALGSLERAAVSCLRGP